MDSFSELIEQIEFCHYAAGCTQRQCGIATSLGRNAAVQAGLDHEEVDSEDHEHNGGGPEADPQDEGEEADEEAHQGEDEAEQRLLHVCVRLDTVPFVSAAAKQRDREQETREEDRERHEWPQAAVL